MIKTSIILILTLIFFVVGLKFGSDYIGISYEEGLSWTVIIIGAYFVERILKYVFMYPFKVMLREASGHVLANQVQNIGFTCAYICLWLSIGVTPVNGFVKGEMPETVISNPIFMKLALIFIVSTVFFSLIWAFTAKLSKK
ncbi:MAG: hypothetical protein KDC84_05395 [Crocinitomicaceae bacterium]|nr:hypothetical protein [Crocinitomicaceae bacterium]